MCPMCARCLCWLLQTIVSGEAGICQTVRAFTPRSMAGFAPCFGLDLILIPGVSAIADILEMSTAGEMSDRKLNQLALRRMIPCPLEDGNLLQRLDEADLSGKQAPGHQHRVRSPRNLRLTGSSVGQTHRDLRVAKQPRLVYLKALCW